MSDAGVKKKVIKLVWSTQKGFRDEKRLVTTEEEQALQELYKTKKPTEKGFLIFIGEPT